MHGSSTFLCQPALFLVSWQSLVENLIIGFSDWDTCPLASILTCADAGENLKKPRWNAELGARTHCPGFPLCVCLGDWSCLSLWSSYPQSGLTLQTEKCVSSFQTLSPEPSLFRGAHPKTILPLLQDKDHSQIFDCGPSPRQLLCPLCLGCRIIPKSFVYPGPGEQAARL